MRKISNIALLALLSVLVAGPSFGQAVTLSGSVHFGLSDGTNITGYRSNNAVPICAGLGPVKNPGTIGTTSGTLLINAQATAAAGVGGAITFNALSPGNGGAQLKLNSTCNVAIPGFANPRLRSRTQIGGAAFPGRKGAYTPNIRTAPVPATPTATYQLSVNGGNNAATTVMTWTTTDEAGPPGPSGTPAPTAMNTFMGSAYEVSIPFFGTDPGIERIQPGAARYGGGVPWSGGGGVQLGVNLATQTPGGAVLVPGDFGIISYANGYLPVSPVIFGTDASGVAIVSQMTTAIFTPGFTNTKVLIAGRQDLTYALRTPGGTTVAQHGAIQTANGGNTATPLSGAYPPGVALIITPVAFTGEFQEWTTGGVSHTDNVGDYRTVRKAQGFDVAVTAGSAVGGETRRLQVVTPWSATIRTIGVFGIPLPTLGFGGIGRMDIKVIPAPEPGTLAMLGFGVAGLVGLGAARRRNA